MQSSHSSAQWLSVLATNDAHVTSGRHADAVARKLNQAFAGQATWVASQQALVEQRRDRCEHLLHLLHVEMQRDADRERSLLDRRADAREVRRRVAEAAKARAEAADKLMRVLQEYGILSGDELADYYVYTINAIKDLVDGPHHHGHHPESGGSSSGGGGSERRSSYAPSYAASSGGGTSYAASRPSSAASESTVSPR